LVAGIDHPFAFCCRPRRDNTNHIVPLGKNDREQLRIERCDDFESNFAVVFARVLFDKGGRIIERDIDICEVDAMLLEVRSPLGLDPSKSLCRYVCTTM